MTQTPITTWQKKKQQKKPDRTGLFVLLGCIAAFLIVLFIAMGGRSGRKKKRPREVPAKTLRIDLTEAQQRELYYDYTAYTLMTGHPENSYKVVADNFGISIEVARAVVAEGRRKGWPRAKP